MCLHDRASTRHGLPERRPRRVHSIAAVGRPTPYPTMEASRHRARSRGLTATAARALLVGGLAGYLGGCAPDEELPLPPVVWEGESVRVRMDDPGIEVCGGSFEALDRHAKLVREALLLEGDGVVEYSIGDQGFVDERCAGSPNESPQACTSVTNGRVFTTLPFAQHEIVHAVRYLDPKLGLLRLAYEEGLATVYGADVLAREITPLNALDILNDTNVAGAVEYDRAGQVVARLLDTNGVEAFRRFDESATPTSDAEAFSTVFGETIEEFAALADASPVCERSQWWQPLVECDGEPIVQDPETGILVLSGNAACGEADGHGPWLGNTWTSRHFRLDQPTSASRYSFELPEDATVEVVACDGGCPDRFAYIGTRAQVSSYGNALPDLAPGEYFLRVSRPVAEDDGWFEIVLE